jgi:hypothetical protein
VAERAAARVRRIHDHVRGVDAAGRPWGTSSERRTPDRSDDIRPASPRWREHLMSPIRDSRTRAGISRSDPAPCKAGVCFRRRGC